MRAALISVAGQPREASSRAPVTIAGKTLARRQVEFALAAGCERIIAVVAGDAAEALALRRVAEGSGARFEPIRDARGLLGTVGAADELLVLAPGLLPDTAAGLDLLDKGHRVLVLPASTGVAAGFERIDRDRAWAGAVVVSGANVEALAGLPADVEPASALLRIALQARVAERRLPDEALADGSWSILAEDADPSAIERTWFARRERPVPPWALSQWLAEKALRPLATRLLAVPRSREWAVAATAAVLAGSAVAAWLGQAALGLALVALGACLAQAAIALLRLHDAPFGSSPRWAGLAHALPWLVDAALFAGAVLAIDGTWLHRLFPPLVLFGTLYGAGIGWRAPWAALPGDRGVLSAVLAIAAGLGMAEPATMFVSLALIALKVAEKAAQRG